MSSIIKLVRTPSAWPHAFSWKPFSITSYRIVTALKAIGVNPKTVLDGGANVGQFARAAREIFDDAEVLSFEPYPHAADAFRKNLPGVKLFRTALGDRDGSITFYPGTDSRASNCSVPKGKPPIDVPIGKLDTLIEGAAIRFPILLKLDLQGFELSALRGAEKTLRQCSNVLVEVSLPGDITEIWKFLTNFGLAFDRPIDTLPGQMDVLFSRRSG